VQKTPSLADFLNVVDPRAPEDLPPQTEPSILDALDIDDPTEFCKKIVGSREFRQYIMNGVVLGDLPPAIGCRIIDHAWGKPPERVEHSGPGGKPIVTEIRRVIVQAPDPDRFDGPRDETPKLRQVTH
jgi:hypothetical protein